MRRRGRCQTPKRSTPGARASARTCGFRLSSGPRTLCTGGDVAKKRILFIDDRPDHLRQPVLRLQLAGYEVEEAVSGAAGLARLRQEPFDLLILDTDLPTEDGWGVLKEVRGDPSLSALKAIVFMAAKGETQKLMLVTVDAELRRPFSMGALLDAVRQVIGEP